MAIILRCLILISVCIVLSNKSSAKVRNTKVLVLGAGAAGVGFANTLLENGMKDFLVLEAQNYVGGRVRHRKFGSITIQEGAGWIHGIGADNPFSVLKNKMGLKATADDYNDFVVRYMLCFVFCMILFAKL